MNAVETAPDLGTHGQRSRTRWEELKETVSLIIELGCCFDRSGVDLFFLNRGKVEGIQGTGDPRLAQAFQHRPRGSTPLTEALRRVAGEVGGKRPTLLVILTDGKPNGGAAQFKRELRGLVRMESTRHEFR